MKICLLTEAAVIGVKVYFKLHRWMTKEDVDAPRLCHRSQFSTLCICPSVVRLWKLSGYIQARGNVTCSENTDIL